VPDAANDIQAALTSYLAALPEGTAKADGVKLGTEAADAILQARADDGSAVADAYRRVVSPRVYVPTPNMVAPQWPNLKPFVMTSGSQFRPAPPTSARQRSAASRVRTRCRGSSLKGEAEKARRRGVS
jgi:hypothetical protein